MDKGFIEAPSGSIEYPIIEPGLPPTKQEAPKYYTHREKILDKLEDKLPISFPEGITSRDIEYILKSFPDDERLIIQRSSCGYYPVFDFKGDLVAFDQSDDLEAHHIIDECAWKQGEIRSKLHNFFYNRKTYALVSLINDAHDVFNGIMLPGKYHAEIHDFDKDRFEFSFQADTYRTFQLLIIAGLNTYHYLRSVQEKAGNAKIIKIGDCELKRKDFYSLYGRFLDIKNTIQDDFPVQYEAYQQCRALYIEYNYTSSRYNN